MYRIPYLVVCSIGISPIPIPKKFSCEFLQAMDPPFLTKGEGSYTDEVKK